jgi:hypothetical protein
LRGRFSYGPSSDPEAGSSFAKGTETIDLEHVLELNRTRFAGGGRLHLGIACRGASFTKPEVAAQFTGWDPIDLAASPAAAAGAAHDACLAGDSPDIDACAAESDEPIAGDCGDGPFACQSGYVFRRGGSQVRISADPTATGNPNAAYVVFDGTVDERGGIWTAPVRVDPQARGQSTFRTSTRTPAASTSSTSAVGTTALMSWTDQRDTVPGIDPRYTNGDGTDGLDVLQCRVANPDGTFGPETCPNNGGLDENLYGFVTP